MSTWQSTDNVSTWQSADNMSTWQSVDYVSTSQSADNVSTRHSADNVFTCQVPGEYLVNQRTIHHGESGLETSILGLRLNLFFFFTTVLKFVFVVLYCKLRLFACSKLAQIDFFTK